MSQHNAITDDLARHEDYFASASHIDDLDEYERICLEEAEEQHRARRAPCMKKMPRYR